MDREKRKLVSQKLKNYNKISYFLYFFSAILVFAFGIYYLEIFELIGGIFLLIRGIYLIKMNSKVSASIKRYEKKGLSFKLLMIGIFSLINPIGIIPFLYEIRKRDWVISGGLDEEKK